VENIAVSSSTNPNGSSLREAMMRLVDLHTMHKDISKHDLSDYHEFNPSESL